KKSLSYYFNRIYNMRHPSKTSMTILYPKITLLFWGASLLLLFSCNNENHPDAKPPEIEIQKEIKDSLYATKDLSIKWKLLTNFADKQEAQSLAQFTFINHSDQALGDEKWTIYFNQSPRKIVGESVDEKVEIEQINGDFYRIVPIKDFQLEGGDTLKLQYKMRGSMIKVADAPCGLYMVWNEGEENQRVITIENYKVEAFNTPEQLNRFTYDKTPIPTHQSIFEENEKLSRLASKDLLKVIPTPFQVGNSLGTMEIDRSFSIQHEVGLRKEALFLAKKMEVVLGAKMRIEVGNKKTRKAIHLRRDTSLQVNGVATEAYHLKFSEEDGISITGNDGHGIFYGIQSFLSLLPVEVYETPKDILKVPMITLLDAPRFPYRAIYLDVARNFQKKEAIFKMLNIMAFYKLNTLVLGLSNDEGWRLEIEGLPELTKVGGFRGHTLADTAYLHPSYCSGAFADSEKSHGSGFYSRHDFIDILRYAQDRHIKIIPELNVPGHARAAIKAMNNRYEKLKKAGQEKAATEFLLVDLADTSRYESVQHYPDNVVDVCLPSTYRFYEKVIDGVIALYQEAGTPLTTIHTGGDEVPKGVWKGSPACFSLIAEKEELIADSSDLRVYFVERLAELFAKRKLRMAGWEEIAMKKDTSGRYIANPDLVAKNLLPYVWNNLWGNQDLGYRLANAGYPVVLCNVTNLYFDLAYNKHPEESGLYWGGFVNTRKAYEFSPYDVFHSTTHDPMGNRFDFEEDYKDMERLLPENRKNILGIQAQLWSETIRGQDMLEYYLFPKMIGLAERAWSGQPEWVRIQDDSLHVAGLDSMWNVFANTLGQKDLPRLSHIFKGFHYRVPPAGFVVGKDSLLRANVAFPSLQIRYTVDGSEPTMDSELYLDSDSLKVGEGVRMRVFDGKGRGSLEY
ncbi:MAG: family 20 glycosylhydrolase, partial [Chitinophagales bacterium]